MSLATPTTIRTLQRKLYRKAKAEPAFRFYLLYDKIYRADILRHAYALARANAGAPGTDGMTFAAVEASGLERWLVGLRKELHESVSEVLAADRARGGIPGTRHRVCRRLRHAQSRMCGRGPAWAKAVTTRLGLTLSEAKTAPILDSTETVPRCPQFGCYRGERGHRGCERRLPSSTPSRYGPGRNSHCSNLC